MIDSHPIKLRAEIGFGLGHQITDEGFQVAELSTVFRRDDQPELMPVILGRLQKLARINTVAVRSVELAPFAITGDTVAPDVFEVRTGRAQVTVPKPNDPRLDDDPPPPGPERVHAGAGRIAATVAASGPGRGSG
ncbi:MAG: hypothetical protein JJ920_14985 [Roseitalea sp.]|nr:hypothetical protein [Roseitalea sp.]MBO6744217.1 hypothetical protein [Roseitalea sp.]